PSSGGRSPSPSGSPPPGPGGGGGSGSLSSATHALDSSNGSHSPPPPGPAGAAEAVGSTPARHDKAHSSTSDLLFGGDSGSASSPDGGTSHESKDREQKQRAPSKTAAPAKAVSAFSGPVQDAAIDAYYAGLAAASRRAAAAASSSSAPAAA